MEGQDLDPVGQGRIGPRLGSWASRPAVRLGLGLLAVAATCLVIAGAFIETSTVGSVALGVGLGVFWAGLVVVADPTERGLVRALAWGSLGYAIPGLALFALGGPGAPPIVLVWPYFLVTALVNCPLELPCPVGR